MRQPFGFRSRFLALAALAALTLPPQAAVAESMALTDILGRTIRAEPVALEGDALKIRREDGREFTIELKSLVDDDQAKIRRWSAAQSQAALEPPGVEATTAKTEKPEKPKYVPDMSKLLLALSRFKGETTTIAKFEGYSHKHEMWGYSFQVTNRNLQPLDKVRIEYNLFARTFADSGTPSVIAGSLDLPAIGSNRSESSRTRTAEVCKHKGFDIANSGGELRGIWVKLYVDNKVVQEQISPESLKTESWTKPQEAASRPQGRRIGDAYVY